MIPVRWILACALVLAATQGAMAAGAPDWFTYAPEAAGALEAFPADAFSISTDRLEVLRSQGRSYVDLFEGHRLEIEEGGVLVERTTLVRRLLSSDDVASYGNRDFRVRPATEKLFIEAAYTLQSDGLVEHVEPAAIQFQTEAGDVFSDTRRVVLVFPNVRQSSTLVSVATRRIDTAGWPLPWSRLFPIQGTGPIERFEVDVRWPGGIAAPRVESDDPLVSCDREAGRARCARLAIPAVELDPNVVWADVQRLVIVSEAQTWKELAAREAAIVHERSAAIPLDEAGIQPGTRAQMLASIYRFVADEIRYVAFEHGTGAVVPRPARKTLERGFGDCKDKVALFLALARSAGLDAYPVLVASSRYDLERLFAPSWKWFDHMLVCVDGPGKKQCLELTTNNAPAGVLPMRLHGAVALELRADAQALAAPSLIPVPRISWPLEFEVENQLDCDGSIQESVTLRFLDAAAVSVRDGLRGSTVAERERWAQELYADVMGDSQQPELSLEGVDEPGVALEIRSKNRFPGSSRLASATHVGEGDFWMNYFARDYRLENRHHFERIVSRHLTSKVTYVLCDDVSARLHGAALDLDSEFGSLDRTYQVQPRRVEVVTRFELGAANISAEEIKRFNLFLDRSLSQLPIWFGFESADE